MINPGLMNKAQRRLMAELRSFKRNNCTMGFGCAHKFWWYKGWPIYETMDYNKEIVPPRKSRLYSDGLIYIRFSNNFWLAALLPYKFNALTVRQIVSVLYPDWTNVLFEPDVMANKEFIPR